jgi:hypothetical protein
MRLVHQIRHWQRIGFYSLLCLALPGFVIAQSQNETQSATQKPAPSSSSSAAPAAKTQHSTTAHTTTKHTSTHKTSSQKSKSAHGKTTSKKRGQQAIDSTRARQIQTALIREHYMQGEPSGTWDSATQAAMQKYQADQGWQSKTTPDSRALIKLGLGPSNDHLLNPESAMTAAAPAAGNTKAGVKQTPAENKLPQQ